MRITAIHDKGGKNLTEQKMEEKKPDDARRDSYPAVTGINRDEHIGMVREIFSTIPGRYDFLNHLLSLRRDVAWRRFTIKKMSFFNTFRLLDVATGTGDVAIEAARIHPEITVTGIDFVAAMLIPGKRKIAEAGLDGRVEMLQADATALPFPDEHFDAASVAFGIRNIPERVMALREMRRVLVPGGRAYILELNAPQNRLWRKAFAPYLLRVLPRVARIFTRNPAAYLYLVDSILHFPPPAEFLALMQEAGFAELEHFALTMGITSLYVGRKP